MSWFRQVAASLHASIPCKVIYGLSIAFNAIVVKHQFNYLRDSVMLARRFRQVAAFLQVLSCFLRSCLVRWMSVHVLSRLSGMLAKMVQTRGCHFVCIPNYSFINYIVSGTSVRDRSGMGCGFHGHLSLNVSSAFLCVFCGASATGCGLWHFLVAPRFQYRLICSDFSLFVVI